jgi:hypothetical protein
VLEFAEEALDQIALAINAPVDGAVDEALAGGWDVSLCPAGSDEFEQCIGIIAAVGNNMTALQAIEKVWRGSQIMGLAGCQHEPNRQAILIDQCVDLGAQSATRTADGVIFAPFFPPAACWWARMIELSMKAIECGDFAANVSKIRTQTPALAQRL